MIGDGEEAELGEDALRVVEEELLEPVGYVDPARNGATLEDLRFDLVDQSHPVAASIPARAWRRGRNAESL